jgi:Uroporphyrinogen decarboxylase (URO-D)
MDTSSNRVFPGDEMTSRERILAAYRGEEVDRVPYWVKVTNDTWRRGQPDDVRAWSDLELLDYVHADGIFGCGSCVHGTQPHVESVDTVDGDERMRITHTPDGDLTERWTHDRTTNTWHPTEFPIKTVEDLARERWLYMDTSYEPDVDAVADAQKRVKAIGQRGAFHSWHATTPLMNLVEHRAGPADIHLMLFDAPGEMEELMEIMHADNLARTHAIADASPADILVSVENTSTTLISPEQFERYCYPHLCEYGRIIEGAGKIYEMHMCGHTLALLEKIDTIPASSIEAYTAPTLGNTRLVDGRMLAPSKTLIGGTSVNTWLKPFDEICTYIQQELDACPDNRSTILTTAGVAPPACSADTFRAVGEWMRTVPVRM